MPTIHTRAAELGDAEVTREIYNLEVVDSTVTMDLVPRSLADQEKWIRAHSGIHPAIVAVDVDPTTGLERCLGFASLSPWRSRPAYSTTVENSVYVHRDHQGRGIGRILLDEILRLAEELGFHSCMAKIVTGHEASVRLHASRGFVLVGVEHEVARKFGRWIDMAVMQKMF